MKNKLVLSFVLSLLIQGIWGQVKVSYSKNGQATPSSIQQFGEEAFIPQDVTVIRWLGSAGFFINSRGTCILSLIHI